MAENKEKAKPADKTATADVAAAASMGMMKKKSKDAWTVERCKKAAKRFTTQAEWSGGAPASFKAATAKGWLSECCGHMKGVPATKRKSA